MPNVIIDEIKGTSQIVGANSEETAYIQNDFPFGFHHRTKRKYWIETTKQGQRLCTRLQHAVSGHWFKTQKETYDRLLVLKIDDKSHVKTESYPKYIMGNHEAIDAFVSKWSLDDAQQAEVIKIKFLIDKYSSLKVSFKMTGYGIGTEL